MKLLSYAALEEMGLGTRSTIWRRIQDGDFPVPLRIGINKVGWPEEQIDAWVAALPTTKCRRPTKAKKEKQASV